MRRAHFFKARSRIGLRNAPLGQSALNIGVEEGADAVLTSAFLDSLDSPAQSAFDFSKPELISEVDFYHTVAKECLRFKELILTCRKPDSTQVVIGGDHSVTFPSVLAVIERMPDLKRLGYIQFDSHGDIHLKNTSPSGNFHGMYVRALLDTFDLREIEFLVPRKIPAENVLYVGNLVLEPEEADFFKLRGIRNISGSQVRISPRGTQKAVKDFVRQFDHLHVTFDVDCLDKADAPATGIPAKKGMRYSEVEPLLREISTCDSLSIDLVEVNPRLPGPRQTIDTAQKAITTLLHDVEK